MIPFAFKMARILHSNLDAYAELQLQNESSTTYYAYHPEALDWTAASNSCLADGGTLAVFDNDDDKSLYMAAATATQNWVGKYKGISLVEILGCGRSPENQRILEQFTIPDNNDIMCLLLCSSVSGANIFGLQMDNCYCMDEDDVAYTENQHCDVPCVTGDAYCGGGDGQMSLYRKSSIFILGSQVGGCTKFAIIYVGWSCTSSAVAVCRKYSGGDFHTIKYRNGGTYEEAYKYCRDNDADIMSHYRPTSGFDAYWQGVRKKSATLWVNDLYEINPTMCMAAEITNGDVSFIETRCSEIKPYVCKFAGPPVDCGNLPGRPNMTVSAPTTTFGSTGVYSCDNGYLDNSVSGETTCQSDGTWTTSGLECTIVDCGNPPARSNMTVYVPNTTFGSTGVYSCDNGYLDNSVSGETTCQSDGTWTTSGLECTIVDCGNPPARSNMTVYVPNTTFGSTGVYSCDNGYLDNSVSGETTCQSDGTWTTSGLECTIVDCGSPPTRSNMTVLASSTTFGSTGVYSCDSGYLPNSASGETTCQADGSWIDVGLECTIVDCGSPPTRSNMAVSASSTTFGSTGVYSCDSGYLPNSASGETTCQADGSWIDVGLECTIVDCNEPPVSANMHVTLSVTTFGGSAVYSCDEGYTPNTASGVTTCKADGSWTDIELGCTLVGCSTPPVRANMQMDVSSSTFGGSAVYSCDIGYTPNTASRVTTCQADGSWTDIGLECSIVGCGTPPVMSNMTVTVSSTTFGGSVVYSCDTGFTPNTASGERTCQADGSWTDTGLECTIVDCGSPPTSSNMAVSASSTTFGSTGVYSCDNGYLANSASGETICQADGSWTDVGLMCTIAGCSTPPVRAHMQITVSSSTFGGSAVYSCDTGYTPNNASGVTTCQADGSWTDIGLECTIVDCGSPPTRSNMTVTASSTTFGSTGVYSCDSGYLANSASGETICQADGSWIDIGLECTIVDCGSPPTRSNMAVSASSTTFGSTGVYTCDSGYLPNSDSGETTCQADGSWIDIGLECTIVDCNEPPVRANMRVTVSVTTFGGSAVYSCDPGYIQNTASGVTTCQADGSWTDIGLGCTLVGCSTPPVRANMQMDVSSSTFGGSAVYSCDIGYTPNTASGVTTCQADGSWTDIGLECTIVGCGTPPVMANTTVTVSSTTFGGSVVYSCDTGYTSNNTSGERTCQADGSWTNTGLECTIVDCGSPPTRSNMAVSASSTTFGSTGVYSCDNGYLDNSASGETVCQADGSWAYVGLVCTIVDCASPPARPNMAVVGSGTTFASTGEYSCDKGYISNLGSGVSTCQADGSWTDIGLVCTIVDCNAPPTRANMQMAVSSTTFGGSAVYSCDTGYTPNNASGVTTCQADGSWTDMGLECTIVDCNAPPTKANIQIAVSSSTFGGSAVYSCDTGYTPNTASGVTTCQAEGSWTDIGLECTIVDCNDPPVRANMRVAVYVTTFGGSAVYSCDPGYTPNTASGVTTCQADGSWKDIGFGCTLAGCSTPPVRAHMQMTVSSSTFGGSAVYSCDTGYTPNNASGVTTCQADGSWTDIGLECIKNLENNTPVPSTPMNVWVATSIGVSVLIVIICISLVLILLVRKRRGLRRESEEEVYDVTPSTPAEPQHYINPFAGMGVNEEQRKENARVDRFLSRQDSTRGNNQADREVEYFYTKNIYDDLVACSFIGLEDFSREYNGNKTVRFSLQRHSLEGSTGC
ncbi:hypothetical protein ScPMuIL_016625 [Solemya velum]